MNVPLLHIQGLKKSFDEVSVIDDLTLKIAPQTISLISGENGAGKTTALNLISGFEKVSAGKIIFDNRVITNLSPLQRSKLGLARLFQTPRIFKNLVVWENLVCSSQNNIGENFLKLIFAPRKSKTQDNYLKEKAASILEKFGLRQLENRISGELSYGQQKLISFCMLAMNGTKLGLLDEPFAGLNPKMIDKISEMIVELRNNGVTFLMVEHNIQSALVICKQHFIMKNGTLIEIGSEIRN